MRKLGVYNFIFFSQNKIVSIILPREIKESNNLILELCVNWISIVELIPEHNEELLEILVLIKICI